MTRDELAATAMALIDEGEAYHSEMHAAAPLDTVPAPDDPNGVHPRLRAALAALLEKCPAPRSDAPVVFKSRGAMAKSVAREGIALFKGRCPRWNFVSFSITMSNTTASAYIDIRDDRDGETIGTVRVSDHRKRSDPDFPSVCVSSRMFRDRKNPRAVAVDPLELDRAIQLACGTMANVLTESLLEKSA